MTPDNAGSAEGFIDPYLVRFTQDSISSRFKGGDRDSIDDLAEALRSGRVLPADIPPIRLVSREGKLYSLDNRRLETFRRAASSIPYRMATRAEADREFARKFDTTTDGLTVKVRGGPR